MFALLFLQQLTKFMPLVHRNKLLTVRRLSTSSIMSEMSIRLGTPESDEPLSLPPIFSSRPRWCFYPISQAIISRRVLRNTNLIMTITHFYYVGLLTIQLGVSQYYSSFSSQTQNTFGNIDYSFRSTDRSFSPDN